MEFLYSLTGDLTDDQKALLGCAATFVVSGGLMALSRFVHRSEHEDEIRKTTGTASSPPSKQTAGEPPNYPTVRPGRKVA